VEKDDGKFRSFPAVQIHSLKFKYDSRRHEASAAVHLMQATYNRIMTEELARNGLIVTRAVYGCTLAGGRQFKPEQSLDVTVAIQCMVKNGTLQLHDSSKVRHFH